MLESENQEKVEEAEVGAEPEAQGSGEDAAKDAGSRFDAAKAFFRALNAGSDEQAPAECQSCQDLKAQVAEAQQKTNEAEGHYKRMAADFENFRRRIEREREEFQQIGVKKAVEALLPALDDLDRAQTSLNAETPAERLLEGINVVFNSLKRSLDQIGVKALTVIGEPFDPRLHEPVQNIETEEVPDGAVVHELRRGYMLNDKVIRPALVNVASHRSPSEPPTYEIDDECAEECSEDAKEASEQSAEEKLNQSVKSKETLEPAESAESAEEADSNAQSSLD